MRWLPVAICLVVMAAAAAVAIGRLDALADIRLEQTRTQIPGSRTVHLDAGKYVVWNEAPTQTAAQNSSYRIEIRPAGGTPLRLGDYGGSFDIDYGGQAASASATVQIPRSGRYEIAGDPGPTRGASVVLGKPTLKPALTFAVSAAIAILAFIGAIVATILAIVLPRKDGGGGAVPDSPGSDPFNAG